MGVHVVHDARLQAKAGLELRTQVRAAPAGHHVVRVRDVARQGFHHAAGRHADAAHRAVRLAQHALHLAHDDLQHVPAAELRLRGRLAIVLDRRLARVRQRHERRRDLRAAHVHGHRSLELIHRLSQLSQTSRPRRGVPARCRQRLRPRLRLEHARVHQHLADGLAVSALERLHRPWHLA